VEELIVVEDTSADAAILDAMAEASVSNPVAVLDDVDTEDPMVVVTVPVALLEENGSGTPTS
jgi:hypothetical protein